jgi:hypothetical protein
MWGNLNRSLGILCGKSMAKMATLNEGMHCRGRKEDATSQEAMAIWGEWANGQRGIPQEGLMETTKLEGIEESGIGQKEKPISKIVQRLKIGGGKDLRI